MRFVLISYLNAPVCWLFIELTNPINPSNVGFITINLKFFKDNLHFLDEQNYM